MKHPFLQKVEQLRAAGVEHGQAMRQAREADEAGYQSWLAEFNEQHGPATLPQRIDGNSPNRGV